MVTLHSFWLIAVKKRLMGRSAGSLNTSSVFIRNNRNYYLFGEIESIFWFPRIASSSSIRRIQNSMEWGLGQIPVACAFDQVQWKCQAVGNSFIKRTIDSLTIYSGNSYRMMSWFSVSVSGAVLQVLLSLVLNGLELSKLEQEIAKFREFESRTFKEFGIFVFVGQFLNGNCCCLDNWVCIGEDQFQFVPVNVVNWENELFNWFLNQGNSLMEAPGTFNF